MSDEDRFWKLYREETRKFGRRNRKHVPLSSSQIVRCAREAQRRLDAGNSRGLPPETGSSDE